MTEIIEGVIPSQEDKEKKSQIVISDIMENAIRTEGIKLNEEEYLSKLKQATSHKEIDELKMKYREFYKEIAEDVLTQIESRLSLSDLGDDTDWWWWTGINPENMRDVVQRSREEMTDDVVQRSREEVSEKHSIIVDLYGAFADELRKLASEAHKKAGNKTDTKEWKDAGLNLRGAAAFLAEDYCRNRINWA